MKPQTIVQEQSLQKLSVGQIFDHDTYRIPIYQRAYAWTATEVETLLRDIRDARLKSESLGSLRDYYLGSLVVNALHGNDEIIYEVIDGQQRLTTLCILLSIVPRLLNPHDTVWAERLHDSLRFEGRERSQEDLKRLARDGAESIGLLETDGISNAATLIEAAARRTVSSSDHSTDPSSDVVFSTADLDYLLKHVRIVRTQLPPKTDLNHYFEVMNTRGEQLEKHEILKARLLQKLKDSPQDQTTFSNTWDACTHLNRHIQVQFSTTKDRSNIFGEEWEQFSLKDSDSLFRRAQYSTANQETADDVPAGADEIRLVDLLRDSPRQSASSGETETDEEAGSYGSIIDFPNFLLHVLKIKQGEHFSWDEHDQELAHEIRLEDKYLLEEFDKALVTADAQWVRDFGWLLLRARYLLDTFVIRTQPGLAGDDDENWVLHRAHRYSSKNVKQQLSAKNTFGSGSQADDTEDQSAAGRKVLMLQAMFQVTDTRRAAKYFLFQTLQWLHHNEQDGHVPAEQLARHLEISAQQRLATLGLGDNLNQGTQVSNFVFNFLDYVLWLRGVEGEHPLAQYITEPAVVSVIKEHARTFTFRYRTSVEHFYPVAPDESQQHRTLEPYEYNQFGNLCIMSRSDNSARSNLIPSAKVSQYLSTNQSLKFQIMADKTHQLNRLGHTWDVQHMQQHGTAMANILQRVVNIHLP